jgi:type I restriction enzyme S subunit
MSMIGWQVVALGDVLTRTSDWVELDPDADYKQVTIRLWGKGVVLRGAVKGSAIAAKQQLRIKSGQFIMSKIDARSGAFGLVPDGLDAAVVSQDFPSFSIDENRVLPGFMAWMSKADWFVALCRAASEGSTNRVRLKEGRFLAQSVRLPSLEEQHRIVMQLDRAAELLENRRRTADEAENELKATLSKTFSRLVAQAPRAKMGDVAPLVRRPVEIDIDKLYAELGVRSFGKGTFHKPALAGLDVGTKRLFRFAENDLIFNIVFAWEGAVAIAQGIDDGRVGSHRFLSCVANPKVTTPQFLRYYFLTKEGLESLGGASPGGAGRNRTLGLDALSSIDVPMPPLEQQQWFNTLQAKATDVRVCNTGAEIDLGHLIPSMLDRAFNGVL